MTVQSEHALQVAVARMLMLILDPDLTWWTALDHGAGKMSKASAGFRKARGVKPGLPDFMLMARLVHKPVIGIELKTDIGRVSPSQLDVADAWINMGHAIFIARSLEDVQQILEDHKFPMRRRMTLFQRRDHEPPRRSASAGYRRARRRGKPEDDLPVVQQHSAQKKRSLP